ncbi:hypothetical protein BJ166DRAFT_500043 [Pestalotiopsis sp. NC0098]|nr:hypothetical protein BJ166DRAFT_500043 [Pestalotiopsis sp. NC0098]
MSGLMDCHQPIGHMEEKFSATAGLQTQSQIAIDIYGWTTTMLLQQHPSNRPWVVYERVTLFASATNNPSPVPTTSPPEPHTHHHRSSTLDTLGQTNLKTLFFNHILTAAWNLHDRPSLSDLIWADANNRAFTNQHFPFNCITPQQSNEFFETIERVPDEKLSGFSEKERSLWTDTTAGYRLDYQGLNDDKQEHPYIHRLYLQPVLTKKDKSKSKKDPMMKKGSSGVSGRAHVSNDATAAQIREALYESFENDRAKIVCYAPPRPAPSK